MPIAVNPNLAAGEAPRPALGRQTRSCDEHSKAKARVNCLVDGEAMADSVFLVAATLDDVGSGPLLAPD